MKEYVVKFTYVKEFERIDLAYYKVDERQLELIKELQNSALFDEHIIVELMNNVDFVDCINLIQDY